MNPAVTEIIIAFAIVYMLSFWTVLAIGLRSIKKVQQDPLNVLPYMTEFAKKKITILSLIPVLNTYTAVRFLHVLFGFGHRDTEELRKHEQHKELVARMQELMDRGERPIAIVSLDEAGGTRVTVFNSVPLHKLQQAGKSLFDYADHAAKQN